MRVIIYTDEGNITTLVDEETIVTLIDEDYIAFGFQREGVVNKTIVPIAHLLRDSEFDRVLQLTPSISVNIKHKNKLLRIETNDVVDVTLSGNLQMLALHVSTIGKFKIKNDMPLNFREGVFIRASIVIIDDMLRSPNFITIITPLGNNNAIHIN